MKSVTTGLLYGYDKRKMDGFIDTIVEAMKTGVIAGYTFMSGSYYYIEGNWYRGMYTISEEDVRAVLYDYYIGDNTAMEMDREWLASMDNCQIN